MKTTNKVNGLRGVTTEWTPSNIDSHYEVEGWQIVMPGEQFRRRKDLQRVAITRAEITFKDQENLKRFLEILAKSDARLSKISDNDILYDWQLVMRNDLTIRFGISWYNKSFYKEKKDTYLSEIHQDIFEQVGVDISKMRIEHIPL